MYGLEFQGRGACTRSTLYLCLHKIALYYCGSIVLLWSHKCCRLDEYALVRFVLVQEVALQLYNVCWSAV